MQKISEKAVELLLEHGAVDIAENLTTPLHWAVWLGNLDIIKILLDKKVDINAIDGNENTPVHLAMHSDKLHIARFLLDRGANIDATDRDKSTLVHYGAKRGLLWIIEYAASKGADLKARDRHGKTALHYAVEKSNQDIVEALLRRRLDANVLDELGKSPLYYATEHNNLAIAKLLVSHKAEVNSSDSYGVTPLHVAALHQSKEFVRLLLEYGADVNAVDGNGRAPIHHAALVRAQAEIVETLLYRGSDINIKDKQGCLPFGSVLGLAGYEGIRCDRSEYDRSIIRLFKLHIVKLKALGLYVSEQFLKSRQYNKPGWAREWTLALDRELSRHDDECKREVEIMKSRRLGDCCELSLFDVLTTDNPRYIVNEFVVWGLDTLTYRSIPIYKSLLMSKFESDKRRFLLLEKCKMPFSKLVSSILPDELLEKVFSHLNNRDLQNLILCDRDLTNKINK